MIYICTAMYIEAKPFIQKLKLKKELDNHRFQIFRNEETVLIITGIGKIKAAVAVTHLLTKYEPSSVDIFINIGVCGANEELSIGEIFLCNKIIDRDTAKTFHPDVLIKHPFKEAAVETCSHVVNEKNEEKTGLLYDMEASAIYQAAYYFLQLHQIFFIKIISDHLSMDGIDEDGIAKLMSSRYREIMNWITSLESVFINEKLFSKDEEKLILTVRNNLKLSATMGAQLRQIVTYSKLTGKNITQILSQYAAIECLSKKEGKKYFAGLKQNL